jgi:hypothetical protein
LADREEVVASTELLAAAGPIPYPVSEARSVTLKGISQPVQIQLVDWR